MVIFCENVNVKSKQLFLTELQQKGQKKSKRVILILTKQPSRVIVIY